jgi:hypothetical protein
LANEVDKKKVLSLIFASARSEIQGCLRALHYCMSPVPNYLCDVIKNKELKRVVFVVFCPQIEAALFPRGLRLR